MKYYVESLNKFQPKALDGFFMSMVDIANYIERHNIQLTFSPLAIFPTSETLTQTGRELLERVFKCKVYDQYASTEGAPFVTECENQNLHMELSTGVFEHIDDSSDEILVTSFSTHGTPLIRYKIGDSMDFNLKNTYCSCGNHSPIVESIQGRKLDFLYTSEGLKIYSANVANLFKNLPNSLIRAQAIQNKKHEIEFLLEVDKEKYKKEYDDLLTNEFAHKFGSKTNIIIKHVDQIPREASQIEVLMADIIRPMIGVSILFRNVPLTISNVYFNRRLRLTSDLMSQIIPVIGQGYLFFGFLLSPIFSIILIKVYYGIEKRIRSNITLEEIYFLSLVCIRISFFMGHNISNLINDTRYNFFYFTLYIILIKKLL